MSSASLASTGSLGLHNDEPLSFHGSLNPLAVTSRAHSPISLSDIDHKRRRRERTVDLSSPPASPRSSVSDQGQRGASPSFTSAFNSVACEYSQPHLLDAPLHSPSRRRSHGSVALDSGCSVASSPEYAAPSLAQQLLSEKRGGLRIREAANSSMAGPSFVQARRMRHSLPSISDPQSHLELSVPQQADECMVVVELPAPPRASSPLSFARPPPKPRRKSPLREVFMHEPILQMAEQPNQFARFRYEAEGRQSYLEGSLENSWPTVAVNPEYAAFMPDGTEIEATLVTREDDEQGNPVPHWHGLTTKSGSAPTQRLSRGKAVFPHLVVQRRKSTTKHNAEDHRAVRLMFTARFVREGLTYVLRVCSSPVFNTELKIDRLSHDRGPASGHTPLIILCSKVQKKSAAVRVSDRPTSYVPVLPGWHVDPTGSPDQPSNHVFVIRSKSLETHHQFAIMLSMPPYHTIAIMGPRQVYVQLLDEKDGTASNYKVFTYVPDPDHAAPLSVMLPPVPLTLDCHQYDFLDTHF